MNSKDRNKKRFALYFLYTLILCSFIVVIFFLNQKGNEVDDLRNRIHVEKTNSLIYHDFISYPTSVFEDKIATGDLVFAYMGNGECPDCSFFYPILKKKIKDYNLQDKIIYVNGEYIHSNKKEWQAFKEKYNFSQTPAFIIYNNKKIVSKIEWTEEDGLSEDSFDEWLAQNQSLINSIQ